MQVQDRLENKPKVGNSTKPMLGAVPAHKFPYNWNLKDANFTKDKGKVFSCFACGGGSTMGYKLAGLPPYPTFNNKPKTYLYIDSMSSRQLTYIKNKIKPNDIIYSVFDTKIRINNDLKEIVNLLVKSQKILDLEDNWDGNGSQKISLESWRSTAYFLIGYSKKIFKDYGYIIDIPKIYPSIDGSIDIAWEKESYGFMINIDASGEIANYYVDNKADQMAQGVFNPKNFDTHILPKAIRDARLCGCVYSAGIL